MRKKNILDSLGFGLLLFVSLGLSTALAPQRVGAEESATRATTAEEKPTVDDENTATAPNTSDPAAPEISDATPRSANADPSNFAALLDHIVITATREKKRLSETAASVGSVSAAEVQEIRPTHSGDALNRIPGVNIVQLGSTGQGTAAAIRQPVSTNPVYLYLENGVPTRSAGFFNHNALYAMDVSGGERLEVIKGPGSALYGSEAIGGIINLHTPDDVKTDTAEINLEGGEFQWKRAQLRGAKAFEANAISAHLDITDSEGWRENTEFERQSFTSTWNHKFEHDATLKTMLTGTRIDMNTGGSGLRWDDYRESPEMAGNKIGYRDVDAVRLSSNYERQLEHGSLSIIPFVRYDDLEYIATWTLNTGRLVAPPWGGPPRLDSQDAHINENGHESVGALLKHRYDFESIQAFWITGLDIDYTQGYQKQTYITRTDTDPGNYWITYQENQLLYDYDVDFLALSPYFHFEKRFWDRMNANVGLRYDNMQYDYDNHLGTDLTNPNHKRPANTTVRMDHLSPKFGLTFDVTEKINLFFAYAHAFRIPSSDQLFRSGKNVDSTELDPVKVDSYELGIRGNLTEKITFEASVYQMNKTDDIVNIVDSTGARQNVNTGKTKHQGIEVGLAADLLHDLNLSVAYTYTRHKFKTWEESSTADFSGNHLPDAPKFFVNTRLHYHPSWLRGGHVELEWVRQGGHYIDQANTKRYNGHDLLNLRTSYYALPQLELYINVLNLTDQLYAETTSAWGPLYTPGRPRSFFAGAAYHF